jgi:hypothetical protein
MTHPVYPTFPTSPAPTLGQVYDSGLSGVWEYTTIGWVKKEVNLNLLYPMWAGQLVEDKP